MPEPSAEYLVTEVRRLKDAMSGAKCALDWGGARAYGLAQISIQVVVYGEKDLPKSIVEGSL